MIKMVKDIDLINDIFGYDVILVGVGIKNKMPNGFQRKIKINFPKVYDVVKIGNYCDKRKLGTVTVIDGKPIFCVCYITKGRQRPDIAPDALEYDSLRDCLELVAEAFKGKRIACPILGKSIYEGGGNLARILSIFEETMSECDLTLYDYEQEDEDIVLKRKWKTLTDKIGKISTEEYYELKKQYFWEKAFGIYKPMPEGLTEDEVKQIINKAYGKETDINRGSSQTYLLH